MQPLDRIQRVWFCATFVCGLVFIAVLPPFQGNDEDSHHRRSWSVAIGDLYCHTIPEAANELTRVVHFPEPDHSKRQSFSAEDLKRAWERRGYNIPSRVVSTSCNYFPLAFVPGAIVARAIGLTWAARPREGGMIVAFYAERLTNWLLASAALLFAIRRLPWARYTLLAFYSIPEVLQQSVALGVDWLLIGGTAVIVALAFSRPRWSSVAVVIAIVMAMTATKPIFVLFAVAVAPIVVALTEGRSGWRRPAIVALVMLPSFIAPLLLWRWWLISIPPDTLRGAGPPWVDAAMQLAYVKERPLARITSHLAHQLWQTFSDHDLMHGHWTSIIGSFGWNAFRMTMPAYYLALVGLALAAITDFASGSPMPSGRWPRRWWICFDVALVAAALVATSATIVAMYIYFTAPYLPGVNGVQGRYYLPSLLLMGVACLHALPHHPRWARRLARAPVVACAAFVVVNVCALVAVHNFYWR